jgi:hypothetical protein
MDDWDSLLRQTVWIFNNSESKSNFIYILITRSESQVSTWQTTLKSAVWIHVLMADMESLFGFVEERSITLFSEFWIVKGALHYSTSRGGQLYKGDGIVKLVTHSNTAFHANCYYIISWFNGW